MAVNKKSIHNLFCSRCGVRSFGRGKGPDGASRVAIDLRCLPAVDVDALTVPRFDGKSR